MKTAACDGGCGSKPSFSERPLLGYGCEIKEKKRVDL